MKLKIMTTHRLGQKSLEPYRPSKSSQKQSKTADMGQIGYAMEKVTRISSRIIDLKKKHSLLHIFGSPWRFIGLFEEARTSQKVPKCARLLFCSAERLKACLGSLTVEPPQKFNYLDALDQIERK